MNTDWCKFEYQFRYREVQKKELDRHSYEVQIKELASQLGDGESSKVENAKLKEFIQRLTVSFPLISDWTLGV